MAMTFEDFRKVGAGIAAGNTPVTPVTPFEKYRAAGKIISDQSPEIWPAEEEAPRLKPWSPGTGIPTIDNLLTGGVQGASDVLASGANLATWVDQRVPALAWLDRNTIGDPAALVPDLEAKRRIFEASPEGQSNLGQAGRLGGQIVTTLPLGGPLVKGVGAGINLLSRALPSAIPSIIPWLARTLAQGGAAGTEFGALTSGGSDQPAGQTIKENALLGAGLGPAFSAVAKGTGLAGRGMQGAYNYLTGRNVGIEVERAMAEARARAGGGAAEPPSTPPPAPVPDPGTPPPSTPPAVAQEPTAPASATPQPQPGGAAATSSAEISANAPTRSREIAGKVDALDKIISDRPNIGRADFTEYVKGNLPTHAEGLGDARLSSIQRQVEPGDQGFTNFRNQAVENRLEHFERRAGTAEQLETKESELANWDKEALAPVWANKKPVDASSVATDLKQRLDSPVAQIGPVEDALKEVEKKLYKRGTDTLHDDPQMLYGARRQISYMLSRAGRQANPAYGNDDVMRELIGVRDKIDQAIEPGAPGFKDWLTGHAERSRDIDRMDVLQSMRQKLIGANGDIQLSRLNGAVKGLRTKMAQGGANPVHSLDIEDIEMLRDLNKDLLREGNKALSMPGGSPTAHNLDVMTEHGLHAVNALAQAGASKIPGAGYVLDSTMGKIGARNAAQQKELWRRQLLAPPPPD